MFQMIASQDDINAAQYQQYYEQLAQQQHAQPHGQPSGIKRQDFAADIESIMGPDAAVSNFLYKQCISKKI